MSTSPKVDHDALAALGTLAMTAAKHVAVGDSNELLIPMLSCPALPGERDEDGVRVIAAIDVLRHLVENHEQTHGYIAEQ